MEYYSAFKKNGFESVLMRWMKLELIISKSERKTPIQYTNAYIWNLERWKERPYMWDSKRDTDVKNRLLDSVGEDEGGMIWEDSIESCILPYVKQMTSPCSKHETALKAGALGQARGMGWEGGGSGGSEWGTHVHPWLIHLSEWQKPSQYYN